MKNFKSGLLLLLLPVFIYGQLNTYHPFPESGIVWVQSSWIATPPFMIHDDQNLFIAGDTTSGNYTYHKLYTNGHRYAELHPGDEYYYDRYFGAFRNDTQNKKVYFLSQGEDVLAYDFDLSVGDTLPESNITNQMLIIVDSIDSVLVGAEYHKRFLLKTYDGTIFASLIEGIGSTCGAFSLIQPVFESGNDLWCVRLFNDIIWNYDNEFSCLLLVGMEDPEPENELTLYPNPSDGLFYIKSTSGTVKTEVFNSLGKQILILNEINAPIDLSGQPDGIYLVKLFNKENETRVYRIVLKE
ncbi:MAG: T9SS type A sorting domain-containing protein [Lentimicrobium sp.]